MNEYKYSDIVEGMKESFQVTVTEEMMEQFLSITGDVNPLHRDREFAKEKGYDNRVVYGMLTASFLSTLAGVYLPGKNSLIYETQTKFAKPVFPGDELTVCGTVEEKNDLFQVFTMKVVIQNQKGEKVLRGKMKVGVLNESE